MYEQTPNEDGVRSFRHPVLGDTAVVVPVVTYVTYISRDITNIFRTTEGRGQGVDVFESLACLVVVAGGARRRPTPVWCQLRVRVERENSL